MKLEFMTEQTVSLKTVLRETRTAEETAEAVIPERCADLEDILFVSGLPFLRGKELTEGKLSVSAGVSATALVQPQEGGAPEPVEAYLPFVIRLEDSRLEPGMESEITLTLGRVDGHMVNPRKILLRAAITAEITVWSQEQENHITEAAQKDICMLKKESATRCLRCRGEKQYTLEDTVGITPEGTMEKLAMCQVQLRHTDVNLTGTRAVWKGEAELKFTYLDPEGKCQSGSAALPFSQYADLGDCQENDELRLDTCLTGAEVEPSGDGRSLQVTLQLLTCAQVWARQERFYVADLYSLKGQAEPEYQQRTYESLLDRQYFSATGQGSARGDVQRVIYAECCCGQGTYERSGELVSVQVPVTTQLLWEDPEGVLHGEKIRSKLEASTRASEQCRLKVRAQGLGTVAAAGLEGPEAKITGTLELDSYLTERYQEVVGAQLSQEQTEDAGPGIVIRHIRPGESLWDAAKAGRTTEAAILAANGLEPGAEPQGMLLIPREG